MSKVHVWGTVSVVAVLLLAGIAPPAFATDNLTPPIAGDPDAQLPPAAPGNLPPEALEYLQRQQLMSLYGGSYGLPFGAGNLGGLPQGDEDQAQEKEKKKKFVYDESRRSPFAEKNMPQRLFHNIPERKTGQ